MTAGLSVLVVDDDPVLQGIATEMLQQAGCEVRNAHHGEAAITCLREATADVVVVDMLMPEKEGLETIIEIRASWPAIKVVAISGGGRIGADDLLKWAKVAGAHATLSKPLDREELTRTVLGLGQRAA